MNQTIPLPVLPERIRPAPVLFGWGIGNFGQLGQGPNALGEISKPKRNTWVEEKIQDGTFGEVGAGLEAIAAGGLHTLLLDEKGSIWSCGVNDEAALGRVTQDVPDPDSPEKTLDVDELTSYPHPLQSLLDENFRAVKIAAGDSISAAISIEGELRAWGSFRANEGSLGFSRSAQHQYVPTAILQLSQISTEKAVAVAAGNNHLLVLSTHGKLYTWGTGEHGQLGRKVIERRKIHGTIPERIILGNRFRKAAVIGTRNNHSFATDESGDVWGWGLNSMGQTGTGVKNLEVDSEVLSPKKVNGLTKADLNGETVVEIVGGDFHTLFLTSGGKVYACGQSTGGQLGLSEDHPAFEDREYPNFVSEPTLVEFPEDDDPVVQISAGTRHNMAVTASGALYAWGEGAQGELGAGADEEIRTPRQIVRRAGGLWAAKAVACGGQHTLGLFQRRQVHITA